MLENKKLKLHYLKPKTIIKEVINKTTFLSILQENYFVKLVTNQQHNWVREM